MKRFVVLMLTAAVLIVVLPLHPTFSGHAASAGRYAAFAGTYYVHDGSMMIRPSGWGMVSYAYRADCPNGIESCTAYVGAGNGGKPGPFTTFQLTSEQGNVALGYVLTDKQPAFLGLPMRVVLRSGYPTVELTVPGANWNGCRLPLSKSYQGQCGA